jgi:hypothetical protein
VADVTNPLSALMPYSRPYARLDRSDALVPAAFRKPQTLEFGGTVGGSDERGPERRDGPRRRVLKSALIVFNDGHCTLGCYILDVSDSGALVRPSDIFLCPAEFVLQPRVGSRRNCEVVWRKTDQVGVRYI